MVLVAEGEKRIHDFKRRSARRRQSLTLKRKKEAQVREAEGEAEAILKANCYGGRY